MRLAREIVWCAVWQWHHSINEMHEYLHLSSLSYSKTVVTHDSADCAACPVLCCHGLFNTTLSSRLSFSVLPYAIEMCDTGQGAYSFFATLRFKSKASTCRTH